MFVKLTWHDEVHEHEVEGRPPTTHTAGVLLDAFESVFGFDANAPEFRHHPAYHEQTSIIVPLNDEGDSISRPAKHFPAGGRVVYNKNLTQQLHGRG